jgi:O-antigen/teichoic acid export membrane protein
MKNIIQSVGKNPFVSNVIIMASGTAAAQMISMLLSPVITRLYGPEAYGLMGTFIAIVMIITPIASLTYPIAIVLPKHNSEAKGIIQLALSVSIVIAGIISLILLVYYQKIVDLFHLNEIGAFLYLIPITILCAGALQVTEQWLIRTKQFKVSARATFMQALISQGSIVGIGFMYPAASVLVITQSLREGLKAILLLLFIKKSDANNLFEKTKIKPSKKTLINTYKDFPLYRAPEVFLNALSQSLPILMLTSFFGPVSAGFYTICKTVLNLPTQLIGKSVGDVFYPRIAEAANNSENLTRLIKKATLSLAAIGIIPFGVIIIFGPWLFSFVFGSAWLNAGEYARWIAIWSYFGFINQPSVRSLPVMFAQSFQLKYTIFMLVVRIIMLGIGYYVFSNDIVAIALFGISGAILNMGLILITLGISKKYDEKKML